MKPVLKTFSVLSLIMCAQLLSACGGSSGGGAKLDQNSPNQAPMQDVMGTGDGGGGNAINFKMLESHIVDPMTFSVKDRVLKMLENTAPDLEGKAQSVFRLKTWYMAPIKLNSIPKNVLGIEFTDDRVQQIAIQTDHEIWIDSKLYEQMSEDEQARLVLHETLMTLYTMRFKEMSEICKEVKRVGLSDCQIDKPESLDELMRPEPRRRLNEKDYNSIRAMTAWFFQNEGALSYEKYLAASALNGFRDSRFTEDKRSEIDSLPEDVKVKRMSSQQLYVLLKEASVTNSLAVGCAALKLQKDIPCTFDVQLEKKTEDLQGYKYSREEFTLQFKNKLTGEIIQAVSFSLMGEAQLTLNTSNSGKYYAFMGTTHNIFQQAGLKGHFVNVHFEMNHSGNLRVASIVTMPMVNVGRYELPDEKLEDGSIKKCSREVVSPLHPDTVSDDMLALATSEESMKQAKVLKLIEFSAGTNCTTVK